MFAVICRGVDLYVVSYDCSTMLHLCNCMFILCWLCALVFVPHKLFLFLHSKTGRAYCHQTCTNTEIGLLLSNSNSVILYHFAWAWNWTKEVVFSTNINKKTESLVNWHNKLDSWKGFARLVLVIFTSIRRKGCLLLKSLNAIPKKKYSLHPQLRPSRVGNCSNGKKLNVFNIYN